MPDWVKQCPDHVVASVFGVVGEDYCIYLADAREVDESGCGVSIEGEISFDLPDGSYGVSCYSPVGGLYSPVTGLQGGQNCSVNLPAFNHDIVVRIRRDCYE